MWRLTTRSVAYHHASVDETTLSAIRATIDRAQRTHRPKISVRKAAERAGISEGWFRQVIKGGSERGGVWSPAHAAPETLLAMAHAVGVYDAVLEMLGDDAPADLPDLTNVPPASSDQQMRRRQLFAAMVEEDPTLGDEEKRHIINQYAFLQKIPHSSERVTGDTQNGSAANDL